MGENSYQKDYPEEYTTNFKMKDGTVALLRPITPDDFELEKEMFSHFSKETQRLRFFTYINEVTPELIRRYTDVDRDIEVGIMAEVEEQGREKMAGVVRLITDRNKEDGEFAVVVADPWQGRGLGSKFVDYITDIAKKSGLHKIYTFLLPDNHKMKGMLERRGFEINNRGDHIFAQKDI